MKFLKRYSSGEHGFILIGMTLTMLMMAVMALSMNRSAGMQTKKAANRAQSIRIHFGEIAAVENARWHLEQNPSWRTAAEGEDFVYDGITYNRKALDCTIAGYEDAVTVSVTAPGAADTMTTHLRWQLINRSVRSSIFYIADAFNNRVRMVDTGTGIITTIAGTGVAGYSGDGGPATSAQLHYPRYISEDKYQNLYIADDHNHCIRKIDNATGNISTVAGVCETAGYNGDNIAATSAYLDYPNAVYVDGHNNIYIGDEQNHRIRKVNGATGIITTVAGTGTAGYNGDNIQATSAQLRFTYDCGVWAADDGTIYIADESNHRIRKVDGATGIITTIAGTGHDGYNGDDIPATSAKIDYPNGIWVDYYGNIYFTEWQGRIRKINGATGIITTVAGNGVNGYNGDGIAATDAKLNYPYSVWINAIGDIYIADKDNNRIRKVDVATGIITTVAGTGTAGYNGDGIQATSAQINDPRGVFGRLYLKDTNPQWGWDIVRELQ